MPSLREYSDPIALAQLGSKFLIILALVGASMLVPRADSVIPDHLVGITPVRVDVNIIGHVSEKSDEAVGPTQDPRVAMALELMDTAGARDSLRTVIRKELTDGGVAVIQGGGTRVFLMIRVQEIEETSPRLCAAHVELSVRAATTIRANSKEVHAVIWSADELLVLELDSYLEAVKDWVRIRSEILAEYLTLSADQSE